MVGIMGFLAEQKVEGAVPLLKGVVPHYAGEPLLFKSLNRPVYIKKLCSWCQNNSGQHAV